MTRTAGFPPQFWFLDSPIPPYKILAQLFCEIAFPKPWESSNCGNRRYIDTEYIFELKKISWTFERSQASV